MSGAWVAGCTRAKALASRRVGSRGAREIACQPSLSEAVRLLAGSTYGRSVRAGQSLEGAQHAVAETLLWNVRVLAGWLPGDGADMLRTLAGWFEVSNVDEHLEAIAGAAAPQPFALGGLATAWPRLAAAGTEAEIREVMATSRWGDPGESSAALIRLRLRAAWAARVYDKVPAARRWATDAAGLLALRILVLEGQPVAPASAAALGRLLGVTDRGLTGSPRMPDARELLARLSPPLRESLAQLADGTGSGQALQAAFWRAESRWWAALERDAVALLGSAGFAAEPVIGSTALLAADARRVRAALAAAAYGPAGLETFDALA